MRSEGIHTEPREQLAGPGFKALRNEILSRRERGSQEWIGPVSIYSIETIGMFVRAQRKEMKLSQSAFAKKAGLGRRFISELESGKHRAAFDHVLKACHVAGLDLSIAGLKTL